MAILDWTWSFSDWILVLFGVGVALYFYGTSKYRRFISQGVPHRKPLPFLGNTLKIVQGKTYFFDYILDNYTHFKDHPYCVTFTFTKPMIVLRDLELIKAVAVKDFDHFVDHRSFLSQDIEPVWAKGLFSLTGQNWRDMRSTLSPAFTSSKMKTMFVLISECCQQLVQYLDQCYENPTTNECNVNREGELLILELKEFYTRYTNDVIATTAFGIGVDSLKQPKNEFYLMGQDATNFKGLRVFKWFGYLLSPRLMRLLQISIMPKEVTRFFRSLVMETVEVREREGIVRPDMLQLLIEAKKGTLQDEDSGENKKTKMKIDDVDIAAQAVLFFVAGFDTASTFLCFATYQLALHQDVQIRLQEEIDQTLQENKGKFTYEVIQNMKYLDMVVSETLRLYPPAAATDRMCVRPYTLKSDPPLDLYPTDAIFIPIVGLHRDPNYFPEPERFDPERFSEENKHNIKPMTYIPFGLGPRSCIGNRFALMEGKLLLAHLLSKFNVKVISKTPIPARIIQRAFSMTIEGGFWLGLEKRKT